MCEDNYIKINYLYKQMKNKKFWNNNNEEFGEDENDKENQNFKEKIKESNKIISGLYNRVLEVKDNNENSINNNDVDNGGIKNIINNNYIRNENKKTLNPYLLSYSLKKWKNI